MQSDSRMLLLNSSGNNKESDACSSIMSGHCGMDTLSYLSLVFSVRVVGLALGIIVICEELTVIPLSLSVKAYLLLSM